MCLCLRGFVCTMRAICVNMCKDQRVCGVVCVWGGGGGKRAAHVYGLLCVHSWRECVYVP